MKVKPIVAILTSLACASAFADSGTVRSTTGIQSETHSGAQQQSSGAAVQQDSSGASMQQGAAGSSWSQDSAGSSHQQGASGAAPGQESSGASMQQGAAGAGMQQGQMQQGQMRQQQGQRTMSPAAAFDLQPRTENGVTYVCGGIGETETQRITELAPQYDMKLTFAASTGPYLADVGVSVADARGNELLRTSCGPIMLVNFDQAGSYRISAQVDGMERTRTVRVNEGDRLRSVVMTWPADRVIARSPAQQQDAGSSAGDQGTGGGAGMERENATPAR